MTDNQTNPNNANEAGGPAKNYSNVTVKKLANSEVEIEGHISPEKLDSSRGKAVERISENLEIPGFRKGKAPESVIAKHIGEYPILEDAAEIALAEEYPLILLEHGIDAIGRPEITVTKLAAGNPLEFKIRTAVMPVFELPDYTEIAKKKNRKAETPEVPDKEIDEALDRIRRNKAHLDLHKKLGKDFSDHDHEEIKDEDLPALDDEFAKSIGEYATLQELRDKVRESVVKEREYQAREKVRIEIIEDIIAKTKIPLPEVLVKSELDKMIAQFKDDVERSGMKLEDYLEQAQKTEADLRKEWREAAEKKAKFQLILNKIAAAENIVPDEAMLEHETKTFLDMYKGADPARVRVYVETVLTNEKVLKHLEELGREDK